MSPEQARGEPLDGRTDVFSLGQILLEMTTGKSLFVGKTPPDVLQFLRSAQEPFATGAQFEDAPRAVEPIIRKALRRKLSERSETAREMLDELKTLQRRRQTKLLRWISAVCAVGILALLGALWLAVKWAITESWEAKVFRTLATADAEVIVTWDAARHTQRTTNSAQGLPVYALAFTQSGQQLIAARRDRALQAYVYSRTRWGQQVN